MKLRSFALAALLLTACHRKAADCNDLSARLAVSRTDGGLEPARRAIQSTRDALAAAPVKDKTLDGMRVEYVTLSERGERAADDLAAASADGGKLVDRVRAADALDGVAKDERGLVDRINSYCSEE